MLNGRHKDEDEIVAVHNNQAMKVHRRLVSFMRQLLILCVYSLNVRRGCSAKYATTYEKIG